MNSWAKFNLNILLILALQFIRALDERRCIAKEWSVLRNLYWLHSKRLIKCSKGVQGHRSWVSVKVPIHVRVWEHGLFFLVKGKLPGLRDNLLKHSDIVLWPTIADSMKELILPRLWASLSSDVVESLSWFLKSRGFYNHVI